MPKTALAVLALLFALGCGRTKTTTSNGSLTPSSYPDIDPEKLKQADTDMEDIARAAQRFSTGGKYPEHIEELAPLLMRREAGLVDPWGGRYQLELMPVFRADGSESTRLSVLCQPPGRSQGIRWPER